jgi:hypothetical protein
LVAVSLQESQAQPVDHGVMGLIEVLEADFIF